MYYPEVILYVENLPKWKKKTQWKRMVREVKQLAYIVIIVILRRINQIEEKENNFKRKYFFQKEI